MDYSQKRLINKRSRSRKLQVYALVSGILGVFISIADVILELHR